MAINQIQIAQYLDEQFSALSASIGKSAEGLDGYTPDVKNALRRFGLSESELVNASVDDRHRDVLFSLAEFFAAKRIWQQLGDRVNHTMGETTFNFTNQIATAKAIMDNAADRCAALGYAVDGRSRQTSKFFFRVH